MGMIGRFGITRDLDGSLSFLTAWPWYWRYPVGVLLGAASFMFTIYLLENSTKPEWLLIGVGCIGVLFALIFMYELGCLSIVVAFLWGMHVLTQSFFPEFKLTTQWQIVLVAAFAYYAWFVGNQGRDISRANQIKIESMHARLTRLEEACGIPIDSYWTNERSLSARIYRLERRIGTADFN